MYGGFQEGPRARFFVRGLQNSPAGKKSPLNIWLREFVWKCVSLLGMQWVVETCRFLGIIFSWVERVERRITWTNLFYWWNNNTTRLKKIISTHLVESESVSLGIMGAQLSALLNTIECSVMYGGFRRVLNWTRMMLRSLGQLCWSVLLFVGHRPSKG